MNEDGAQQVTASAKRTVLSGVRISESKAREIHTAQPAFVKLFFPVSKLSIKPGAPPGALTITETGEASIGACASRLARSRSGRSGTFESRRVRRPTWSPTSIVNVYPPVSAFSIESAGVRIRANPDCTRNRPAED